MYEDEVYKTQITYLNDRPFFHVDVKRKLTKRDIRNGRIIFKGIKAELVERGYERLYAITPSPHFARLVGVDCEHVEFLSVEGQELEMIVWELKQQLPLLP